MSCSEFGPVWKQKIRTVQKRLDLDGDGAVTWKDFAMIAERFVTVGGATVEQGKNIEAILTKMWMQYFAEEASKHPLTPEVYLASVMAVGKKKVSATVFEIYSPLFDVIDTNGDGHISVKEYQTYYKVLGLDTRYADESFKVVDSDHNGEMSRAEYLAAVDDFFCSENPSNFWGPLVK